jgi:hypothetical protein
VLAVLNVAILFEARYLHQHTYRPYSRCNPEAELAFPTFSSACGGTSSATSGMASYLKSSGYAVNGLASLNMTSMHHDPLHASMGYPGAGKYPKLQSL